MKTITYTCDCCNKSSPDYMDEVEFYVNEYNGEEITNININNLCSDCRSSLCNEISNSMKALELKYKSALIEPEVTDNV